MVCGRCSALGVIRRTDGENDCSSDCLCVQPCLSVQCSGVGLCRLHAAAVIPVWDLPGWDLPVTQPTRNNVPGADARRLALSCRQLPASLAFFCLAFSALCGGRPLRLPGCTSCFLTVPVGGLTLVCCCRSGQVPSVSPRHCGFSPEAGGKGELVLPAGCGCYRRRYVMRVCPPLC